MAKLELKLNIHPVITISKTGIKHDFQPEGHMKANKKPHLF